MLILNEELWGSHVPLCWSIPRSTCMTLAGFRFWNMCNIQAGLTVLNQTDTAKRMEKNRLYFSWYVDRVNILFILFSILKCSHLPRWTLVSLHTYSCQKEVMVMTNQTNHHPSLNTTLSLPVSFFFFFCPRLFHKTISKTTNITD